MLVLGNETSVSCPRVPVAACCQIQAHGLRLRRLVKENPGPGLGVVSSRSRASRPAVPAMRPSRRTRPKPRVRFPLVPAAGEVGGDHVACAVDACSTARFEKPLADH